MKFKKIKSYMVTCETGWDEPYVAFFSSLESAMARKRSLGSGYAVFEMTEIVEDEDESNSRI